MLMIFDNVINVGMQIVSYVFIYSSMRMFSKLFNWVFVLSCLLDVLFYFYVNDTW